MTDLLLPTNFPLDDFLTTISPHDKMYTGSSEHYLRVGLSALSIFEFAIRNGLIAAESLRSILDLPCGHGRVARIIKSRFPRARLTVCDLDRDGVDFCTQYLDANGVYSCENFEELRFDNEFDLIWVGSLITHLTPGNMIKFIRCMERFLSPTGLLIISNHGRHTAGQFNATDPLNPMVHLYNITGYGYDTDAHAKGYGGSIISREWLEGFFASEPCMIVGYFEQLWDNNHDVFFVKSRSFFPPEYDAALYLAFNKDLVEARADPILHYGIHGRKEDRRFK